jgi:prefoldin subunit 5
MTLSELEAEHDLITDQLESAARDWVYLRAKGEERAKLEAAMDDLTAQLRRLERKIRKLRG